MSAGDGFADDVLRGLTAQPKTLPSRWFYDEVGSALFDAITRLPEYYLTRTEDGILERCADQIVEKVAPEATLVELGCGNARKTARLVRAMLARQHRLTYCPIDISSAALEAAGHLLRGTFPTIDYRPIEARYRAGLQALQVDPRPKLVLFIGSNIGNFDPDEAVRFLADVRAVMHARDRLLVGFDMVKDPRVLHAAYDDPIGLTRAFNLNLLARINRELGGGFGLAAFRHEARWDEAEHRMESRLVSRHAQEVRIAALGLTVPFRAGERIHVENSYKFTEASIARITAKAGFGHITSWSDEKDWFRLALLEPA